MTDRGRVPFAVVGVLLLVSSATVAVTQPLQQRTSEPAVERAVEDVRGELVSALRLSAREAGREAARHPVVTPANTTVGRALDDPFRDSLRLRLYERFRRAIVGVESHEAGVAARARIAGIGNASSLRDALDRTSVARAGPNGTSLRASVAEVEVTVRRDGRIVERVTVSPSVVVGSPVMFVHDRVARFERRLNAAPTEPGLGRRLSARLYPVAWARGYAQYGGAGIENVVGTRHVELATNDALLAAQRAAFGRTDPAGEAALESAAGRVAARDVAEGFDLPGSLVPLVADGAPGLTREIDSSPTPDSPTTVSVGRTADGVYRSLLGGKLSRVTRSVYETRVRLSTSVTNRSSDATRDGRPGANWTLVDRETTTRVRTSSVPATSPAPDSDWHPLRTYDRHVVRVETAEYRRRDGGRTRTTTTVERTAADVRLTVLGRHDTDSAAPSRRLERVHDPGGPLSGSNLADVEPRAVERLVGSRGGPDELAIRALDGDVDASTAPVVGERPSGLRLWVARDLIRLRERVRNVSVSLPRGDLGTYRADPAARLATELRDRRGELVAAPERYENVAEKARVAARAAYFDRVIAALERRSGALGETRDRFRDALADDGISLSQLSGIEHARSQATVPESRDFAGLGGPLRLRVDAAPAYLSVDRVAADRVDAAVASDFRGLATRNRNLFTLPYGDVADTVFGDLFGEKRARMRTAARALQAVESIPDDAVDESVRARRTALRDAVTDSLRQVRARYRYVLRRQGVGEGLAERRAIVGGGLSTWETPAARALAVANGSATAAVHSAAVRRADVGDVVARDELRLALRAAGRRASDGGAVTVPQPPVNRASETVRDVARSAGEEVAKNLTERAAGEAISRAERRLGRSLARVPAGLPVTPVPAYWYVTTNVWTVDARGRYARFTVRASRGVPGARVTYSRDGSKVRYDWDGDGHREALGRASRVQFETETVVAVVVPPGGQGVGDVGGDADERSPGW